MKNLFFLFFVINIVCSCKDGGGVLNSQYGTSVILKRENISIPIDSETLTSYQIFSAYNDGEYNYILGYNSKLHAIDIIDVYDRLVSHVQLKEDGENGVLNQVSGIFVHSMDSIWVYSQNHLYLIDTLGCVKNSVVLPFPTGGFIVIDTNFSIATNKLFYHPERESIFYLTAIPTEVSAEYKVYEYNLNSKNFQSYDLKGGELEKESGKKYGWKQFPNVSYTLDKIVYNFPISSNVYSIDLKTKKETATGGRSKFTSNLVSELVMPYDFQMANKHLLENIHFFELQYDYSKDVYYRLHLGSVEYVDKQNFNDAYSEKNLYMTVFNKNFEIINESDLGMGGYNCFNYWGILNDAFFIARNIPESDETNVFQFDQYTIN